MSDANPYTMTPEAATNELAKMGEAYRGAPPSDKPTTPTEARARLGALTSNKEWSERYLAGNVEARQEFASLTAMVAEADDRLNSVLGGQSVTPMIELTTDEHPLTTRNLAGVVADFRELGVSDATIRQAIEGEKVSAEEFQLAQKAHRNLTGNAEWTKKYLAGDFEARRDMQLLSIILNSEVAA